MFSWKENVQRVKGLMEQVSQKYGGDDPVWFDEYFHQVILENSTKLETVIAALSSML